MNVTITCGASMGISTGECVEAGDTVVGAVEATHAGEHLGVGHHLRRRFLGEGGGATTFAADTCGGR